jgi:hypothetical protein
MAVVENIIAGLLLLFFKCPFLLISYMNIGNNRKGKNGVSCH